MKPHVAKFTIRLTICAAALLLDNRVCSADPCPNDGTVTLMNEETLASQYQPYGSILHRYRFVPPTPYGPTYPTVLMLPPDIFKLEYGDSGVPTERQATYDLQQAGFLVFQVDHRLAPPGALTGQIYSVTSGRFPQQTDDIKRQIMAALADSQCNGSIYLVGGSAGGCLALWVMLDSTGVLNLGWNDTVRTKIKAVVSLSGPAKLCDWQNPGGIPQSELTQFEMDLDNYVGLPQSPPDQDCSVLDPASPYTIVSTATSSPPVMLYACQGDPVPYEQATQMHDALIGKFPSLEVDLFVMDYGVMDQTNHAYKYWHALNTLTGNCVSSEVIAFLQSYP